MAIVKEIRKVNKLIKPIKQTVMDYNFDENYYSIWTYKSGDISGAEGTKQTLQFDKANAKKLLETLEEFINN